MEGGAEGGKKEVWSKGGRNKGRNDGGREERIKEG